MTELTAIPEIGPRLAAMLRELGYQHAEDLKNENAEKMYARLIAQRGEHIDRCVLYIFRFAVAHTACPEKTAGKRWWHFKK